MRISDWSSDVCSSDLPREAGRLSILAEMALFGLGGSLLGRSILRLGLILGNRFLSHDLVLLGGLLRRRLLGGGFGLACRSRFLSVGGLLLRSRPPRLVLPIDRAPCRDRVFPKEFI